MAYYDPFFAETEKLELEQYQKLLEYLNSSPEFVLARRHLIKKEIAIKSLELQVKIYYEFFEKLGKLIPPVSNIMNPLN